MFKGIKVLVIMFVVYFGLLNAMDSEDIPMPVDAPWSITSNKVIGSSQPSLLTQIKEMPSAVGVFSDEEIGFSAPHVSNRKKPRGNLFNIAMLPVVLGVRTFVGITKFLERRPVLRTATVCVVQGLGEAVTHNPQEAFSLVNSGFAKCGGAVCKYFGPKEIAGTAGGLIVLIGPMLPHISSALPSILSGGGLFATLWVKNRVNAIGTQLDETSQILQKKLDDFRKEEQEQHTETRQEIAKLLQKMEALQQQLKTAQTQLEGRIDQESQEIQNKIVELSGQVSSKIDALKNQFGDEFSKIEQSVSENSKQIAKMAAHHHARFKSLETTVGQQTRQLNRMGFSQIRTEKKVDDISKQVVDISEQQKKDSNAISATNGRVKRMQATMTRIGGTVDTVAAKMDMQSAQLNELNKKVETFLMIMRRDLVSEGHTEEEVKKMNQDVLYTTWKTVQDPYAENAANAYNDYQRLSSTTENCLDKEEFRSTSICDLKIFVTEFNGWKENIQKDVEELKKQNESLTKQNEEMEKRIKTLEETVRKNQELNQEVLKRIEDKMDKGQRQIIELLTQQTLGLKNNRNTEKDENPAQINEESEEEEERKETDSL